MCREKPDTCNKKEKERLSICSFKEQQIQIVMPQYYDREAINVIFFIVMKFIYDSNVLYEAFRKSRAGSQWKESVQLYEVNYLRNINDTIKELKNGTYKQSNYYQFILYDRGKTRSIKAVCIKDRVVIRAICDNYLNEKVQKYLIYDNGASIQGKGLDFTRRRVREHLRDYYRHYGSDGYVLRIDFSKFFDNMRYDKLMDIYSRIIDDDVILKMVHDYIYSFRVDVSYMNEDEYKNCMDRPFDSIQYEKIDKSLLTAEKYMYKGMGIGSQISQISGLIYPYRIDNYCKIVRQCRYYARYMDDIYIIHNDKQFLKDLLYDIRKLAKENGLFINDKKTQIIKLSKGFSFLKHRYYLSDTGRVIDKIDKKTVTNVRRKLKRFKGLYDKGEMSLDDVNNAYNSMLDNVSKGNSYRQMKSLEELYNELFGERNDE